MKQPIKVGDKCEVIMGMGKGKSPNIGLEVMVVSRTGEHSVLGNVWHCTNPNLCQLGDAGQHLVLGWADIPTAWLRKIDDLGPSVAKTKEVSLGL